MKRLLIILTIFIGVFSFSNAQASTTPTISLDQTGYVFEFPGRVSNTGVATSTHFTLDENLVPTTLVVLMSPVNGATSTTASLSCNGSAYAYWIFDLTSVTPGPGSLTYLRQEAYFTGSHTRPSGVTDCFMNFVTGNQLEAFQEIPKNTAAGGDAESHPAFVLYTGTPLDSNTIVQQPSITTGAAFTASTTQNYCNNNFSSSSNPLIAFGSSVAVGICNTAVTLFVPSLDTINQFKGLASTTQTKIPFSYGYDFASAFQSLTASSSTNLPDWSIDLSSVNLGSSTPLGQLFSPTLDYFSTTTIGRYFPDSIRIPFLNIERFAIWFGIVYLFYRRIIPEKPSLIHHT